MSPVQMSPDTCPRAECLSFSPHASHMCALYLDWHTESPRGCGGIDWHFYVLFSALWQDDPVRDILP